MTNDFARDLCEHRAAAGLSLRRLGAHLGVSFSSLARIERGIGQPDAHTKSLLMQWMHPEQKHPYCQCTRCTGIGAKSRLDGLEEQIVAIQAILAQIIVKHGGLP